MDDLLLVSPIKSRQKTGKFIKKKFAKFEMTQSMFQWIIRFFLIKRKYTEKDKIGPFP